MKPIYANLRHHKSQAYIFRYKKKNTKLKRNISIWRIFSRNSHNVHIDFASVFTAVFLDYARSKITNPYGEDIKYKLLMFSNILRQYHVADKIYYTCLEKIFKQHNPLTTPVANELSVFESRDL